MRGLFWILALFAAAVGMSLVARYNDGYVLLFVAPKRVELSLTLFAFLQVTVFVLLYFFARAASYTLRLPDMVREFHAARVRAKARHALFDALVSSFEGRFARAERSAGLAFSTGEEPALAGLVAARAAHQLGHSRERDEWLAKARAAAEKAGIKPLLHAVLMTQAELYAEDRRDLDALAVLRELNKSGARHIVAQRLALNVMTRAGQWEEALRTARQLEEHKAVHPAVMARTREAAYAGMFDTVDAHDLAVRLRRIPRSERRLPAVARTVARALVKGGLVGEARELIEAALEREWDDELGRLYADCARADGEGAGAMLECAEAWSARYPGKAELLLSLGRICAAAQLWGKAREYLELAIAAQPQRRAHVELARVFDAIGHTEEANGHYRLAALA